MWKGFKGQSPSSTVAEYLRGSVHALSEEQGEKYVYVNWVAMLAVHKVHASSIEQDTRGWLAAGGGRCYRRDDVLGGFHEMVLCPECPPDEAKSWRASLWAYEAHYLAKHT